jgi:ketosteroid isomerase-like protein
VAALYSDDATVLPPGSAMTRGQPAISAMWKGLADQVVDPQLQTLDVTRLGQFYAREIGIFSLTTKEPSPKELTGKYVVIWKKIDRRWKLSTDIWNDAK